MKQAFQKVYNYLRRQSKPVSKPPVLFKETQEVFNKIHQLVEGDFMVYWGTNFTSMASNDILVFDHLLEKESNADTLYLFVKSNGGSGKAALRLIHLLRSKYKKIIVLAPINCASAATMLALGADEIHMGPLSFLTAIDTSVTHELSPLDNDGDLVSVNQNELDRVLKLWSQQKTAKDKNAYNELYKYIHPLVFGSVDRASSLSINLTNEILSYHMDDKTLVNKISNHLNAHYSSHDYPITSKEAKSLGLNIKNLDPKLSDLLMDLNQLYSKMAKRSYTDFSPYHYHDNQIYTIIEARETMVFYQKDREMLYRKASKDWGSMNDKTNWIKVNKEGRAIFYIR